MSRYSFATLFVLAVLCGPSPAQTTIPGGAVSETWGLSGSPYQVEGDIWIPDGQKLHIEPGVVVEFTGNYFLNVEGCLLAVGNEKDSILFTASDTTGFANSKSPLGGWGGIRFMQTAVENDSSLISYCMLTYAKACSSISSNKGAAIHISGFDKVRISDTWIRNSIACAGTEGFESAGGAIYLDQSDVLINNCMLTDNSAQSGGALYLINSNPLIQHSYIASNTAVYGGGMLSAGAESLTLTDIHFSNNKADWGGGLGMLESTLKADQCTFSENHAEIWGGGIAADFSNIELLNTSFQSNTSDWGSGGLHIDHTLARVEHCEFFKNEAIFGGGIHALFCQLNATSIQFTGNMAENGGGIHLENSDGDILLCHFNDNKAFNGNGGAIDCRIDSTINNTSYELTMKSCELWHNSASLAGGAVNIDRAEGKTYIATLTLDACLFERNGADTFGALSIRGSLEDAIVDACQFRGNTSRRYGGGMGLGRYVRGTISNCAFFANYSLYSDSTKTAQGVSMGTEAMATFLNCTFADSSSAGGVGLSLRRGSLAYAVNCIFWGSGYRPINIVTANGLGSSAHVSYCDIENGMDSIYVSDSLSNLDWGKGNLDVNPCFADLKSGDLHLSDSSRCIGTGVNSLQLNDQWLVAPAWDIEKVPRPNPENSAADMGAYEHRQGSPISTGRDLPAYHTRSELLNIYPNPFLQKTIFVYHLSAPDFVQLEIYNLAGQQVARLLSKVQSAGSHTLDWDGAGLAAGAYFYCLRTGSGALGTGKLIKL